MIFGSVLASTKGCWRRLVWMLLPTLQLAWAGNALSYRTVSDDGGAAGGASLAPGGAGGTDSGGHGAAPSAGNAGNAGDAGCVTTADCGPSANRCAYATCIAGVCGSAPAAAGLFVQRDTPADCFDLVCDATGQAVKVLDQSNVPNSSGPCVTNGCDAKGNVFSTNAPKGAACSGDGGAKLCDGAGQCVPCLGALDCAAGQTCSTGGDCVTAACADGRVDGTETDIDCGGSCSACATGKDCGADQDCASNACNAIAPHRCVATHCSDNHQVAFLERCA
jgi:hypothetical protein